MKKNKPMTGEKEMRMIFLTGKLECRQQEEDQERVITGYAAVFEQWSKPIWWFKEQIARGAFDNCDFNNCIACYNHDDAALLARFSSGTLKLDVDEVGLRFEFAVPNTTLGNDVYELVKRGDVSQCSFEFKVESEAWKYAESGDELDERTITAISELWDVSLVTYPAYEGTSVDARSANFDALAKRKEEYLSKKDNSKIMADSESRARICQVLGLGNAN